MSTDREILELAAKAAGVFMTRDQWPYSNPATDGDFALHFNEDEGSITGPVIWYGSSGEVGGTDQLSWNPLNDDGDALRLAMGLGFHIGPGYVEVWRDGKELFRIFEDGDDPYADARRAIVRAAAEIGRAMQ